jgi:hypothetical protein
MELTSLLWEAPRIAHDAGAGFDEAERSAGVPLSSLLGDQYAPIKFRHAEVHARRRAAIETAVSVHRVTCEASEAFDWLAKRPGYARAMRRLVEVQAANPDDSPSQWWFDVTRSISHGVVTLLLLRSAEKRGRLHLTAQDMRAAAALARRLKLLLTSRVDLPEETRELLKSDNPGRRGAVSRLEAAAAALDRLAGRPGRKPKNDATAVERKVAADLARELRPAVRAREDVVPVVADIFDALGLTLDTKRIAVAITRALD